MQQIGHCVALIRKRMSFPWASKNMKDETYQKSRFHDLNTLYLPFLNTTTIFHIFPIKHIWEDEVSGGSGISLLEILFKILYEKQALESLPQFPVIMPESSIENIMLTISMKICWLPGISREPPSHREVLFFPVSPDRKEPFPRSFYKDTEDF